MRSISRLRLTKGHEISWSASRRVTWTPLKLVYLNGNNAAEGGENNIKHASSYPMNWTVKHWSVQDFKGHGQDTAEWHDYDKDNVSFERLEKVHVPDEDSLEQRMKIFYGQL